MRRVRSCGIEDVWGERPSWSTAGPALRRLKKRRRNGSRSRHASPFAQVQSPLGFRQMNFASDNTAPVTPAILDALAGASRGYARGYGNDDWTEAAERRFCEIFERDVAAFLVPTGTAANALALAQVWREAEVLFDERERAALAPRLPACHATWISIAMGQSLTFSGCEKRAASSATGFSGSVAQ